MGIDHLPTISREAVFFIWVVDFFCGPQISMGSEAQDHEDDLLPKPFLQFNHSNWRYCGFFEGVIGVCDNILEEFLR